MKAPKCPVCGVSEWRHLCGNVALKRVERAEVTAPTPERKPKKRTKPPGTKPKGTKGGRPREGKEVLSAAERKARWKAKQK